MATQKMGLLFGLEKGQSKDSPSQFCKRQNRWLFEIPGVVADDTVTVDALPPSKSARPNLSFKEMEVRHLIEDVFYPAKPEWKPITVTVFDLTKKVNPIWNWIIKIYDPEIGRFYPAISNASQQKDKFVKNCFLKMFDGCGNTVETWVFEDAWCNAINFQTLDMGSAEVMMCEMTLRYARAYLEIQNSTLMGKQLF